MRGFHLPALYAPLGMYSWETALKQFKKGKTNPQELKVFINNVLGETWADENIKSFDPEDLETLAEDYAFGEHDPLPKGIGLITAGVDTHPSHVDIVVRGWGRGHENWFLDYVVIDGDPNQDHVWEQVYEVLTQVYTHHTGIKLRVAAACVDTGGHNTEAVYNFCRDKFEEYILAIKGTSNQAAPIIGNFSLVKEGTVRLFPVGKPATHGRLFSGIRKSIARAQKMKEVLAEDDKVIDYSGPQVMHFHKGLPSTFYKQLTAPKSKWAKRDGKWQQVYETTDKVADHAHDSARYADAAFGFLNIDIDRLCKELDGVPIENVS
ncbi:terminase gpA endonuclease subunit [Pseudobacteriovorax antillogorgiicola]|uniref:terminase gpA endonuclease subunit n=1 Tax=Pseudobacteriovorax antillogorgiicola TaxID=1513793 RepID=UPI002E12C94F